MVLGVKLIATQLLACAMSCLGSREDDVGGHVLNLHRKINSSTCDKSSGGCPRALIVPKIKSKY